MVIYPDFATTSARNLAFDPNIGFEINQPQENDDGEWYRMRWRDLDNPEARGMKVWLYQQESAKNVFIKHFPEAQVWVYTRWD